MTRRIDRTTARVGNKFHVWHTEKLWQVAKDLPVFEVEIESLRHVDAVCWFDDIFRPTLRNVVEHFVRMQNADPNYPVILDPNGQIFDGAHRVAKALSQGRTTIHAVQMAEVPPPDEIVNSIH